MFEIFKEFTFEAAHHLAVNVADGHRYSRLHGHSFQVQVFLKGEADKKKNWVCDFDEIAQRVAELRAELDHHYLNEIVGLEVPTLENISRWIWNHLDNRLPGLDRVIVRRGSCGEGCVFYGRAGQPSAPWLDGIPAFQNALT
jgi:6-pyruvoyltetrahydropterin/6-carboxytetrahydropterin synthase